MEASHCLITFGKGMGGALVHNNRVISEAAEGEGICPSPHDSHIHANATHMQTHLQTHLHTHTPIEI